MRFFGSQTNEADLYLQGMICLKMGDSYGANSFFRRSADKGHLSALYNSALLNGGASISPFDIDYAIDCFRAAGNKGHQKAGEYLFWLDKAEDTSFGTIALSMFAANISDNNEPNHLLMMVGCSLYNALCKRCDVFDSVIEYELDAASTSEHEFIHEFIERTGISKSVYRGGLNRIQLGSAADQIKDGLNDLFFGLKQSGHSDELCLMIRCTIVGYLISKSRHAHAAMPLLGVDKFFG